MRGLQAWKRRHRAREVRGLDAADHIGITGLDTLTVATDLRALRRIDRIFTRKRRAERAALQPGVEQRAKQNPARLRRREDGLGTGGALLCAPEVQPAIDKADQPESPQEEPEDPFD